LVGGVLVGSMLIKQSTVRSQVADIDKFKAAVSTFEVKYDCLPGDCKHATDYFNAGTQPAKVSNGDDSGHIDITNYKITGGDINVAWGSSVTGNYSEWASVFDHLSAARLWEMPQYDEGSIVQGSGGAGVACPMSKIQSNGGASDVFGYALPTCMAMGYIPAFDYVTAGHKIVFGGGTLFAGGTSGLNPQDAFVIDSKIDDGKPFTGNAVIMGTGYIYRRPAYCATVDETEYLTESQIVVGGDGRLRTRACSLYIDTSF